MHHDAAGRLPDDALTRAATPRRTVILIALLALLVAALALCINRDLNGDLYLLLFSGRYVAEHGPVGHDPFPTIQAGAEWLNQQWLSELAFYGAERVVGVTGVTVLYALLLAVPLGLLLMAIRHKGWIPLVGIAALYFPGLLAIIHPRAAGFTLLLFAGLVLLLLAARRSASRPDDRAAASIWILVAVVALFALWANLHGGFIAGLLLIGLVTAGLAIDRWRGIRGAVAPSRILALGAAGLLATAAASLATPLGPEIWSYILSFGNPALELASTEWEPATQSPLALCYIAAGAAVGVWIWRGAPAPRAVMPALVMAGFLLFAASSMRNLIFVAPALAFGIACSATDRPAAAPGAAVGLAAAALAAAGLLYGAVLGPPNADRVGNQAVQYALDHPPERGRIAAYAGPSSYMLWRDPETPVVINGWLEHFTEGQLRANFGILHGSRRDPTRYVRRLDVGAVIAYLPDAIDRLEANGFVAKLSAEHGTYLVRRGLGAGGTERQMSAGGSGGGRPSSAARTGAVSK
jgi:hypothetical protein